MPLTTTVQRCKAIKYDPDIHVPALKNYIHSQPTDLIRFLFVYSSQRIDFQAKEGAGKREIGLPTSLLFNSI